MMLPLWRNVPLEHGAPRGSDSLPLVHPSGRQAISTALREFEIGRRDRVGIPEWSSACLIGAVGRYAMPVPVFEAQKHNVEIRALLIYEQWGWPIRSEVFSALLARFPEIPLIIDRVDSPLDPVEPSLKVDDRPYAEVRSLSKVLGLPGGGLLAIGGNQVPFRSSAAEELRWQALAMLEDVELKNEIAKSQIAHVPDAVKDFVENNDLDVAYALELAARKENLRLVLTSAAAAGWEDWMIGVLEAPGAPGIAPLFRGMQTGELEVKMDTIAKNYAIESCIYHFNFSSDPLRPEYELCLAIPVHGMVRPEILARLLREVSG